MSMAQDSEGFLNLPQVIQITGASGSLSACPSDNQSCHTSFVTQEK